MTPLYGHVSQDTAHLVRDYPYGGKRCRIRFWIEQHATRGFRFMSQTENPKTLKWNNPRSSTYSPLGMVMILDEKEHVQAKNLNEYSSADEVLTYLKDFSGAPVNIALKAFIVGKRKVAEKTSLGEAVFKQNGVPLMPTESDIAKALIELPKWHECFDILKERKLLKEST